MWQWKNHSVGCDAWNLITRYDPAWTAATSRASVATSGIVAGSKGPEFCAPCAMTQKLCPCRCSGWTPVSVLYTTRSTTSPNFRSRTLYPAVPGGALGGRAPAVSVASSSEGAAGAENVMLLKKKYCGLVEESTPVDSRMLTVLVEGWVDEKVVFSFFFSSFQSKSAEKSKHGRRGTLGKKNRKNGLQKKMNSNSPAEAPTSAPRNRSRRQS
jgi:hypothetical protein